MSGHSKWSTIKHKKGAEDERKGKLFSQLSKNIRLAVKTGGSGDTQHNSVLRLAVEKARASNMSKENIARAIDRGMGKGKEGQIREVVYEGFGPQGVGILVIGQTDNSQRTGSEIRNIFSKHHGSLGAPGSVKYMFKRLADSEEFEVQIPVKITDPNIQEQIQSLLDNLVENDDVEDVYCSAVWF